MDITNWDPDQYLKYKNERTQPSIDLVNRIELNPKTIIDIGCGPGNSTQILYHKWKSAEIEGLDNSQQMIEKAKKDHPHQNWIFADASVWQSNKKYDLVFSNATLQWIKNHESLILKLFQIVNENGALAVQLPANFNSYLHKAVIKAGSCSKWRSLINECKDIITYQPADFYYDILTLISKKIDIWETIYYHMMDSHNDLLEWYKSTGMKVYLDSLIENDHKEEFINIVLEECKKNYKPQKDGKILFQFKRLFFIAYK